MRKRYRAFVILVVLVFLGTITAVSFADEWRADFDEICAKVSSAQELSSEELETLVKRVDELIPVVESSGDPKAKVFIFRLKKCKDMFTFILDTRK